MNPRHRAVVTALAVLVAALAACSRETRVLAADQPRTPPTGHDDPRIPRYQGNAYQLAQGGRYFTWYGCGACHASGASNALDAQGPRRHGDAFDDVYRFIADGHANPDGRYGERIPVEQLWQITAYVRELPTIDAALRRRQDIDQAGEPQATRWSGAVR